MDVKQTVHENTNYRVCVVRMPEMSFDTYAIINKDTGVVEQIQPNLYNARYIAEQFNKWLIDGPDHDSEVESFLNQITSTGRAN